MFRSQWAETEESLRASAHCGITGAWGQVLPGARQPSAQVVQDFMLQDFSLQTLLSVFTYIDDQS